MSPTLVKALVALIPTCMLFARLDRGGVRIQRRTNCPLFAKDIHAEGLEGPIQYHSGIFPGPKNLAKLNPLTFLGVG